MIHDPPLGAEAHEMRILLVEDSAPLRMRLMELLTKWQIMRVTATASTEAEALNLIGASDFDVLVVDVELKPGSGIEVVRRARQRWTMPPLPLIIVLTNHASNVVRQRAIAAGADHFLDKMLQFKELDPLIRSQGRRLE